MLPAARPDGQAVGLLLIYAMAGMALSQVMSIASVGHLGVATASFHIDTAPLYVMLIMVALGGSWSWPQAIGAAIVGLGVVLAQRYP
ncbi:MAG: EamA family transporter [Rhodobacteraceae bacterium]|nr:EamA family transporter [Paracoccaceae bacterium]